MKVGPPEFSTAEREVYGAAVDTLEQSGVRHLLGGALALNLYTGIWRNTKDLDVFVSPEEVDSALRALEAAGFDPERTNPRWLSKARRGELFLDLIHANQNGINRVDDSWFEAAAEAEALGRRVRIVSPEDLIVSKLFVASRDRFDLSDVLHVIFARRGDLDWERILSRLGEHWELLLAYLHFYRYVYPSHTNYLPRPVMVALVERFRQEPSPASGPRFRGTMLDAESFRVDVEAWGLPDERVREAGA